MNSAWKRLRYRTTRTWLRHPIVWLRHRGLDANDVFIAEYPRSGSTWLRFMLVEILTGSSAQFLNVNRTIPEIGTHGKVPPVLPGEGRLIKTHEPYRSGYKRAVYLVRDVRDVMFSVRACDQEFGWGDYFSQGRDLDGYIQSFFVSGTMRFGTWQDHVLSFLDSPMARSGDLLLVRYEDMRRNPEEILTQILDFLGVKTDDSVIRDAIAGNSLESMRAKEDSVRQSPARLEKGTLLRGHKSGRFVGKGAVGGWRERLTAEQLLLIDRHAADAMQRLGYPLGGSFAEFQSEGLSLQAQ
jgi:hypothetical protein